MNPPNPAVEAALTALAEWAVEHRVGIAVVDQGDNHVSLVVGVDAAVPAAEKAELVAGAYRRLGDVARAAGHSLRLAGPARRVGAES